jgi:hypothetical protein
VVYEVLNNADARFPVFMPIIVISGRDAEKGRSLIDAGRGILSIGT